MIIYDQFRFNITMPITTHRRFAQRVLPKCLTKGKENIKAPTHPRPFLGGKQMPLPIKGDQIRVQGFWLKDFSSK